MMIAKDHREVEHTYMQVYNYIDITLYKLKLHLFIF